MAKIEFDPDIIPSLDHASLDWVEGLILPISKAIRERRVDLIKATVLRCDNPNGYPSRGGCGAENKVGDLTLIRTHWYEMPHGCTGGDTWHAGEANYVCPKCGIRHRLVGPKEHLDKEFARYFKDTVSEHKRSGYFA